MFANLHTPSVFIWNCFAFYLILADTDTGYIDTGYTDTDYTDTDIN